MTKPTRSNPTDRPAPRPVGETDGEKASDFERSQLDIQIDDPGDAQRASKSDAEGDGEEELR